MVFNFMKVWHSARKVQALAGVPSNADGRVVLRQESFDAGLGVAVSLMDTALVIVLV